MVKRPIRVTRDGYTGRDMGKRLKAQDTNRLATLLENHINGLLQRQTEPIHAYDYHEIAGAVGVPVEIVRRLCFAIDCGHNGFTAVRSDLTFEEAHAAQVTHIKERSR